MAVDGAFKAIFCSAPRLKDGTLDSSGFFGEGTLIFHFIRHGILPLEDMTARPKDRQCPLHSAESFAW